MTASVKDSGSQTATVTTEHTLTTLTDAGTYQLVVDVNALAGGATPDILELRIYTKARTGDTERIEELHTLIGAQSRLIWRGKPALSPHSMKFTLKQTQGTSRSFPWAVYNT